ncbi:hypothetical protein NQ314_013895 [Rhamnusium bicolor]|uniref:Protein downstream neighbor of son homolog n=1 Tax=Rhamnusium bicolor TaxID=1586634 RepID=A0AAV8X541_9CUCU|nr:hypothetical protein NQ314_013895 [Rhamnusium bicolor]
MAQDPKKSVRKWHHPSEVMKLHKLKQRKKALQISLQPKKKKILFIINNESKKSKNDSSCVLDESSDQTLFKLINYNIPSSTTNNSFTSFNNILSKINTEEKTEIVEVVKAQGETWLPIDWALKNKVRLLSAKPFPWNQKLKISEEASGITAYTRCLDSNTETTLDTSPNAKFHQCCLYWQQPSLPWLKLFPRSATKAQSAGNNIAMNNAIKDSLQTAWSDSLRSLYQLIRTRQCPYFYACANNFTVLFRAAGICGFSDVNALITPTTRGFRHMLRQEGIDFTMPLKKKRTSDQGYDTLDSTVSDQMGDEEIESLEEEEAPDEDWLQSMGVNAEDIKQINYTQEKIIQKSECEVDNSEQSLVVIEGVDVHALYNFLINCKSATSITGALAGIPPTLLAPVAFHGAALNSLKVRENKAYVDNVNYYSLDLIGPILPSTIHNLFAINSPEHSLTMTFNSVPTTESFSKIKNNARQSEIENKGSVVFGKENLSDCGLLPKVLQHFCTPDLKHVTNVECLKYTSDNKTYTWT